MRIDTAHQELRIERLVADPPSLAVLQSAMAMNATIGCGRVGAANRAVSLAIGTGPGRNLPRRWRCLLLKRVRGNGGGNFAPAQLFVEVRSRLQGTIERRS